MCDTKAKEIRMNAETKVMNNNVRHYGDKTIIKDVKIASILVKELIRKIDTEEEECNYMHSKFKDKDHLVEKSHESTSRKRNYRYQQRNAIMDVINMEKETK